MRLGQNNLKLSIVIMKSNIEDECTPFIMYTSKVQGKLSFPYYRRNVIMYILAQSIYTHYSSLSGRPDIFLGSGTFLKKGPKYGLQKAGCKKQGHCYSKREEAA